MRNMFAGFFMVFFFMVMTQRGLSQSDSISVMQYDTNYIRKMNDYLALKLSLNDNIHGFGQKAGDTKFDFLPNDRYVLKLSVNYRWLSFNLSAAPKFLPGNDDNDLKGKTSGFGLGTSFTFDHWVQTVAYSKIKGFYLSNTGDFQPGWIEGTDPYVQFPDYIYQSFYGKTAYKFNKRFSFNALSVQTERQLKSAGTFIPSLSYHYYIQHDKGPLEPGSFRARFNNFEMVLAAGYYYTLVLHKQFYVSAGLNPGIGFITSKYTRQSMDPWGMKSTYTDHDQNILLRLDGSVALGYNAERFFVGGQLDGVTSSHKQQSANNIIYDDRIAFQVFVGYRLGAPKFLKNLMDKADEKKAALVGSK